MALTRRRLLGGITLGAVASLLAACSGSTTATPTTAPSANGSQSATPQSTAAASSQPTAATSAQPTQAAQASPAGQPSAQAAPSTAGGKYTYWGGLIFSDAANNLQKTTIETWLKAKGFTPDVVMINQNETNQKVAAALQAGNMPDALDMGLDLLLQLSTGQKVVALDDIFDKIGTAHGGWVKSADQALDPKIFGGHRYGIPFGTSGNLLNYRKDVLEAAGFKGAPQTWQDLVSWSEKAQKPPQYWGVGFALSNVGDGNEQVDWLHSWGGRIADDAGKTCTLKSQETQEYLQFVADAYKKNLFPPGVTTWDGAGDNNAYQSGKALFIGNPGSVYLWCQKNDPDLASNTGLAAFPKGPKLKVSAQNPNVRAIPVGGKNVDAGKDLLTSLADDSYNSKYFPVAIYGPVLVAQQKLDVWKDPIHAGLLDLALNGSGPSWPDVSNAAYSEFGNNFIVPKMIQHVVIDKWDVTKALDDAQKSGEAIYAKYNKS